MQHWILTVMAPDQPGLVERLAKVVAAHGGNWLESRMARMAGQFAGILRVAVAEADSQPLLAELEGLARHNIRVQVAASGDNPGGQWQAMRLDLLGNDRPGIVRDISRHLAERGVNVESLTTEVRPAPMSGEPLFHAEALLAVPASLSTADLKEHLEALADDLMVELKLGID